MRSRTRSPVASTATSTTRTFANSRAVAVSRGTATATNGAAFLPLQQGFDPMERQTSKARHGFTACGRSRRNEKFGARWKDKPLRQGTAPQPAEKADGMKSSEHD